MFSDKLKSLRLEHQLTQLELSQKLNVAQGAVANWETGKRVPDIDMIIRIADYFNVSLDWLTGNSEYRNINDFNNQFEMENQEISNVYFSFAKEAQDEGIDPEDIKRAIEIIKNLKKKDRSE